MIKMNYTVFVAEKNPQKTIVIEFEGNRVIDLLFVLGDLEHLIE